MGESEADVRRQFGHDEDGMVREIARLRSERDALLAEQNIQASLIAQLTDERDSLAKDISEAWAPSVENLRGRLDRLNEAWDLWADHSLRRHECDWGYTERPGSES